MESKKEKRLAGFCHNLLFFAVCFGSGKIQYVYDRNVKVELRIRFRPSLIWNSPFSFGSATERKDGKLLISRLLQSPEEPAAIHRQLPVEK